MNTAVAYARYSTDRQTENSIAYQLAAIKKYCNDNNITITDEYIDEGLSGTNTNRPEFQRLLSDAKLHKFNNVVIYDISRGSRNISDWFQFREQMKFLDIKVISCSQQLGELDDPNNFLVELINVGIGQHMVLDTRKKSLAGAKARASQGKFMGGYPPYGYDIVNGNYVINEKEAKIVKTIFEMFIAGDSYGTILDYTNKAGAVGKRGKNFGKNSIYSILKNIKYTGVYMFNNQTFWYMRKYCGRKDNPDKVVIKNGIPQIIDEATFAEASKRMKKRMKGKDCKTKREYLLSGLIKCPVCGAAYVGRCSTNKKGIETRYYTCGNKYRTMKCKSKNINADLIEGAILKYIKNNIVKPNFDEMVDIIYNEYNSHSKDMSKEKKEYSEVQTEIANIVKAIKKGILFDELEVELERLKLREIELKDLINTENRKITSSDEIAEKLRKLKKLNSDKEYCLLIHSMIERIIPNHDCTKIEVVIGFVDNKSCGSRI